MSGRKNLVLCALLATFVAYATPAYANIYPPTPIKHFYGDANGDTGITGLDLVRHNNYILSKSYTYDTLQPQTPSQLWNTCDIDSDRGCTGQDVVQFTNYLLSNPVTIDDNPWHIQNFNLPEAGNSSGVWIPFSANLFSSHPSLGDSGRPGISVVAQIDAASSTTTGELSGRTCSPVAGSREQAAATDAQCALAVTVTDWAAPGQGLTESGAYGLQIKADGEGAIKLNLFISAIPGLDIPLTTTSVVVNFAADQLDIECPPLNEDYTGWCWLNLATGPGTCSIGPNDTCGGFTYTGCNGYSLPMMGEAAGPGTCIAEIVKGGAVDTNIVTILEVNQNPTISVNCPESIGENVAATCPFAVIDPDLPPQTLTCTVNGATTCGDVTLTGCTSANIPAQGEGAGPGLCEVVVDVQDTYNGTVTGSDQILILESNRNPYISMTCPASVKETDSFACAILGLSDPDLPAQTLNCSLLASCTGAVLNGCTSVDIPPQMNGPSSCWIRVTVNDSFDPPGSSSTDKTISIIMVNEPPTITLDCPANVPETDPSSCVITVSDPDLPPQPLSCFIDSSNTCPNVTLNGCIAALVPAQGEYTSSCKVAVYVQDSRGTVSTTSDVINFDKVNEPPIWMGVTPPISTAINKSVHRKVEWAVDNDAPNDIPIDPGYLICEKNSQNCSFNIDVTGEGPGYIYCDIDFWAGPLPESCDVEISVTDGQGLTITDNVDITVSDSHEIWYVDVDASGANTGTSWADAFTALQDAVSAAMPSDEIWVAEGVYHRPVGADPMVPVMIMKDGISVYGGFAATETNFDERQNPAIHPTILDGENTSYRVIIGASNIALNGFEIINGGSSENPGGGLSATLGQQVHIESCVFRQNYGDFGGAILSTLGSINIINCIFDSNSTFYSAPDCGGAVYSNSQTAIENGVFRNNFSDAGGALYLTGGTETSITRCLFEGNDDNEFGDSIYNSGNSAIITNCTFVDGEYSGDIYNYYGTLTISNSIIWGDHTEINDYNSATTVSYSNVRGGYPGIGNINIDPMFQSEYKSNYHLAPTSPCRDTGDPDPARNDPDGTRNDMGAFGGPGSKFDSDYDGMENWWELLFGFNPIDPADAALDPDGDSISNIDEFYAGLNPLVANILYVDAVATGAGTGMSWADAFNDIQDAVDAIGNAGTIWVAEGIYTNPSTVATHSVVILKDMVRLIGGFSGTETRLSERGDPVLHETIMDGEGTSCAVLIGATNTLLDGFTIMRGNNSSCDSSGAGISNNYVTYFDIRNCLFIDNAAENNHGGGISNNYSSTTVTNCQFINNSALEEGGAIYSNRSSFSISNCAFNNNISRYGGAVYIFYGPITPIITNCVFFNNQSYRGGAIYCDERASPTIINCTFSKNVASYQGGAIYNLYASDPLIINNIMWGDIGTSNAEIYSVGGTNLIVTHSDIQGGWPGVGNIDADPLFVGFPDLHLQSGSPCINAGTSTDAPLYDLDGNPRPSPLGGLFDMGAYEYQWP